MPLDQTPIPNELRGLRVALLISGGIAAYKLVDLASALAQAGCQVRVAMTSSATRFVGAPSFQGVTGNPVLTGLFGAAAEPEPHVFLGDWAQVALLAPATFGYDPSIKDSTGRLYLDPEGEKLKSGLILAKTRGTSPFSASANRLREPDNA